jgi:hypothetical protein
VEDCEKGEEVGSRGRVKVERREVVGRGLGGEGGCLKLRVVLMKTRVMSRG